MTPTRNLLRDRVDCVYVGTFKADARGSPTVPVVLFAALPAGVYGVMLDDATIVLSTLSPGPHAVSALHALEALAVNNESDTGTEWRTVPLFNVAS